MSISLEEMIFWGYRAKEPWIPPDGCWKEVELICNVGDDLCEPRKDWPDRWDFNRGFCYNTPNEAWQDVGGNEEKYKLFAYFVLPYHFMLGRKEKKVALDEILDDSFNDLPTEFKSVPGLIELGFDVAEHNLGFLGYSYSPLMTNGFSSQFPVNRFGLCDSVEEAIVACHTINKEMPEHGNHWVFRVLGQLGGSTATKLD